MIYSICFQSRFNNIRIYRLGTAQFPEVFDFSIDDSVELARTIIVSHNWIRENKSTNLACWAWETFEFNKLL